MTSRMAREGFRDLAVACFREVSDWDETQRGRVETVAQTGRRPTIAKLIVEVGVPFAERTSI